MTLLTLMNFVLILFIVLLLHKGRERYSNIMLVLYFTSQVVGIAEGFIYYAYPNGIPFTFYPFNFTWAPLFFFYIYSLLDNDFRLKKVHLLHAIPFIVVITYTFFSFYIKDFATKLAMTKNYQFQKVLYDTFSMVFNAQIIGYNIWAFIKYRRFRQQLKQEYSNINISANNWLKTSLFGFLIACLVAQLCLHGNRLGILSVNSCYFIGNFTFLLFFVVLFYKAIVNPDILASTQNKEKYKMSSLTQTEAQKMLFELEILMQTKQPFTNPELTLKALSQMSAIPERTLSQIINEYKHQNFFDFVNSYRVKYAMELLKNKQNHKRTMLDILFDAGFNSKSTFNAAFKKQSGETPSEFKNKFL
jgi:AraC-like DNA-binding protein